MTITKTVNGSEATLKVDGWLDTQASPDMQQELDALEPGIDSLVLDFADLEYISSAGLRVLLSAQKVMSRQGGMKLKGVGDVVMDILEITGFSNILTIE